MSTAYSATVSMARPARSYSHAAASQHASPRGTLVGGSRYLYRLVVPRASRATSLRLWYNSGGQWQRSPPFRATMTFPHAPVIRRFRRPQCVPPAAVVGAAMTVMCLVAAAKRLLKHVNCLGTQSVTHRRLLLKLRIPLVTLALFD